MRATITSTGGYGTYAGDLGKVFQARRGTTQEIALLLTSMLRCAGLEAHPMFISTRDHGRILRVYPVLRQFNRVLTYVKTEEREYFLEATDPLRPGNLLPVEALTNAGWVVEKKTPRWVGIAAPEAFHSYTTVSAKLAADGSLTGWLDACQNGYSALHDRRSLRDKKEDEYVREGWINSLVGARLDSFRISNKDSVGAPLKIKAYFSSAEFAPGGENIYFNPIVFGRREENPFKNPGRTLSVDFDYGSKQSYTLNLTLPEGYSVLELPKNILLSLPNEDGQFRRIAAVEGNQLQYMSQLVVRKTRFTPEEYQALREFYDRVVAAQAEQVVLKRETSAVVKEGVK